MVTAVAFLSSHLLSGAVPCALSSKYLNKQPPCRTTYRRNHCTNGVCSLSRLHTDAPCGNPRSNLNPLYGNAFNLYYVCFILVQIIRTRNQYPRDECAWVWESMRAIFTLRNSQTHKASMPRPRSHDSRPKYGHVPRTRLSSTGTRMVRGIFDTGSTEDSRQSPISRRLYQGQGSGNSETLDP